MAISLNANYLSVTGGAEAAPYSLADVYQYCVDNSLSYVTFDGNKTYNFYGRGLELTGVVHFKELTSNLTFTGATPSNFINFTPYSGSIVLFQDVNILTLNKSKNVRFMGYVGSSVEFLRCKISTAGYVYLQHINLRNCLFDRGRTYFITAGLTFDTCVMTGMELGLSPSYGFESINGGILVNNSSTTFYQNLTTGETTFRNIKAFNSGGIRYRCLNGGALAIVNYVDCVLPTTGGVVLTDFNGETRANFKSTFVWGFENTVDLKVYNAQNELILDKTVQPDDTDELQFATKYIQIVGGAIAQNVETNNQPLRIVASRAGYDDLLISNIFIDLGEKNIIRGKLVLTPAPIPLPPSISQVEITQASSPTESDGQITITGASGTLPYEYSLNGTDWQVSNIFTGLAAGEYTVYVKDSNDLGASIAGIVVWGLTQPILIDTTITGTVKSDPVLSGSIQNIEITGVIL